MVTAVTTEVVYDTALDEVHGSHAVLLEEVVVVVVFAPQPVELGVVVVVELDFSPQPVAEEVVVVVELDSPHANAPEARAEAATRPAKNFIVMVGESVRRVGN